VGLVQTYDGNVISSEAADVCMSADQARLSAMDRAVAGRSSQSPSSPEPDASGLDETERMLRRDDPLDDRERPDRIESPLSRLATSAKKDDELLGHRSLRNSTFSCRTFSQADQGFRKSAGDGILASAASLPSLPLLPGEVVVFPVSGNRRLASESGPGR